MRLSERSARSGRVFILAFSIAGLVMVFQPLSLTLFGMGCGVVFVAALIFNLMPELQAGRPVRDVLKTVGIIALIFAVFVGLAVLAAYGYVLYLQT